MDPNDSSSTPTQVPALGATVSAFGVTYRVWAPRQREVKVRVDANAGSRELPLIRETDGYWSVNDPMGQAGDLYRYFLADGKLLPDPASRSQPFGVSGPSACVDPAGFQWRCDSWRRPAWKGQSVYEIHLGTFTPDGTFLSAIKRLDHVRDLGVEAVELMPLADFAGNRNWGYDGVFLYAPARCYGSPDECRALVDAAHQRGLAVIIDLVYNHLGPSGNCLADFSPDYFRTDGHTPWGSAFNLDGLFCQPVRDFFIHNATYWLDEFRVDGVRLDATHAIPDRSSPHVLCEIAESIQKRGGFVIAEDERNESYLVGKPAEGGLGMNALWADDFHHEVRVALTGSRESYFQAYGGTAMDIADTIRHGWTYRGQAYAPWKGRPRGSRSEHLSPAAFIYCIENHDQVGNRANGERLEHLVTPAQYRAAAMLLCLSPYTPLLFMGQEWSATTPFLYFTDHGGNWGSK